MKFDVVFSEEGLNTALTAINICKYDSLANKDEKAVKLLRIAEEELRKAVVKNEA